MARQSFKRRETSTDEARPQTAVALALAVLPTAALPYRMNRMTPHATHRYSSVYPETKTTSQPQPRSELGISRVPIPVQMQIQRDVTSSRCGYIVPDISNDGSNNPQHSPCLRFLVVSLNPTPTMSTTLHQLTDRSAKFRVSTFILH